MSPAIKQILHHSVSKIVNSNEEHTVLYNKCVLLSETGGRNDEEFNTRVLVWCDDFKGHSVAGIKAFNAQ